MLLLIDNYDSFTYNLYQYLCELGEEVRVVRNDKIGIAEIEDLAPERIVVSPGPCTPAEAGISVDVVRRFEGRLPILGVCLGHQAIGAAYGGVVAYAGELRHGKSSPIYHDGSVLFAGLPNPFDAVRYHSLAIQRDGFPECLEITAWTANGIIMGVRHKRFPTLGVQFHPESILTHAGKDVLRNFLRVEIAR